MQSFIEPLPLDRHTLDNGLRVVLQQDRRRPLVAVNIWYHVGSKNETPGRTGFAHLFEHLCFQGSAHVEVNEHFRYIQEAGGVTNGSTWFDRTVYHETLPAHELDLALWLEADRMGFLLPAMTQAKLDNQREVVINERHQRVDNQPYGGAFERLHELIYPPGHPYRWPVLGYVDDLRRATLEDVGEFYRIHYVPNNAVLSVVGDFGDDVLERIEHYFGAIPRAAAPPAVIAPELFAPGEARPGEIREVLPDQIHMPRVYMGYAAPPYGSPGWYAGDLLATVLCGGKTSPLYEDLVYRRELAKNVGCYIFPTELTSIFVVVATASQGVEPGDVEDSLREHFARLVAEPLPEERVERARNQLLMQQWNQMQTLQRRADLLSCFTTYFDDPALLGSQIRAYEEASAEDLRAFACRFLDAGPAATVTVVPTPERKTEP